MKKDILGAEILVYEDNGQVIGFIGMVVCDGQILITRRGPKEELDIGVVCGELCMEASYDYGTVYIELITYYCEIVKGEIYLSVHDGYESLPENYPIVERIREDFRVI